MGLWTFTQGKGIKHEKYEKWVQLKAEILALFGEVSHTFHCKGFFKQIVTHKSVSQNTLCMLPKKVLPDSCFGNTPLKFLNDSKFSRGS